MLPLRYPSQQLDIKSSSPAGPAKLPMVCLKQQQQRAWEQRVSVLLGTGSH